MKKFASITNFATTLNCLHSPGETVIHTVAWGDFKIRKNGKVLLAIGEGASREVVKCTPILEE